MVCACVRVVSRVACVECADAGLWRRGRWSDEQLNRMRSGMLLPWRRKLLDATGFFSSTTESS